MTGSWYLYTLLELADLNGSARMLLVMRSNRMRFQIHVSRIKEVPGFDKKEWILLGTI
jgi:hypothetical protein